MYTTDLTPEVQDAISKTKAARKNRAAELQSPLETVSKQLAQLQKESGYKGVKLDEAIKRNGKIRKRLEDANTGVICRSRVSMKLPLSKLDSNIFIFSDAEVEIALSGNFGYGIPFGKYGRLIWAWFDTYTCRNFSHGYTTRRIYLGKTLTEFASTVVFGAGSTRKLKGKQLQEFVWNFKSLVNMKIRVTPKGKANYTPISKFVNIVDDFEISSREKHGKKRENVEAGFIEITEKYIQHAIGQNPPIDLPYYASLKASRMDIYFETNRQLYLQTLFKTKARLNKKELFERLGPKDSTSEFARRDLFVKLRSIFDDYRDNKESPFDNFTWTEDSFYFYFPTGSAHVMTRSERRRLEKFLETN